MTSASGEKKDGVRKGPLDEFWRYAGDFHSVYALVSKLAIAAPLVDLVIKLGPPWPSRLAVSTALVLVQVLVLICSFLFWRQGRGKIYHIKKWALGSAIAFVVLFMAVYFPLFSAFIVDAPDAGNRVVIGYELQQPIQRFVDRARDKGEIWTAKRLIAYFADDTNDEKTIWTPGSVDFLRCTILGTWMILGIVYAVAVAAFVSLQYRRLE